MLSYTRKYTVILKVLGEQAYAPNSFGINKNDFRKEKEIRFYSILIELP